MSSQLAYGADGIWNGTTDGDWLSITNWSVNPAPGATTGTTNGDTATFNNAGGGFTAITTDLGRNIKNITFDGPLSAAYTIGTVGGNPLLLTTAGTIKTTSGVINTQTINAPLQLQGATYSFDSSARNASSLLNFGGGITGATGSTVLTLTGTNTGSNTVSGVIDNGTATTVGISKTGAGTWVLSNTANTYTGPTTISRGTLNVASLANGGANSSIGASSNAASNLVISAGINQTATLQYTGTTAMVTDRNYTIGGTIEQTSGTIDASGTGNGSLTINGNMNSGGTSATTIGQLFNLTGTGTGTAGGFLGGTINNGTGTAFTRLVKKGTGTWTLNGAAVNTYTGFTVVENGTLVVDFANLATPTNLINSASGLRVSGGTLEVKQKSGAATSQTFANTTLLAGASTIRGSSVDSNGLTVALGTITRTASAVASSGTLNFILPIDGSITTSNSNTNGILGTWATTGSGTSLKYATVSGGAIAALIGTAAANASNLTDTTGTVNYDLDTATGSTPATVSANTIRYTGGTATTAPGGTSFTVNGLMNAGAGTWTIGTNKLTIGSQRELVITGGSTSISSVIANNGAGSSGLTFNGNSGSTLTLSGINTYTGVTTVLSGALNATGTIGGALTVGSITGGPTASVTIASALPVATTTVYSNGTLNVNQNTAATTGLTVIGGAVNIATGKIYTLGSGTVNMTAGSISGGTLKFNAAPAVTLLTSADAALIASNIDLGTVAAAANFTTASASGAAIDLRLTGVISNGATGQTFTKAGAGVLSLEGANTFISASTVTGGTLLLMNSLALQNSAFITGGGGTLAFDSSVTSHAFTLGGLTGSGSLVLADNAASSNAVALTLKTSASASYSGILSGAGSITKTGAGTQTLSAANTYAGNTTISAGTLALGASGTFANSPVINLGTSGSQGTLDLTAKSSFAFGTGQTLSGYGTVNIGAGKTVTINGNLAVGNSPGVITVTGDTALGGTATTTMELAGSGGVAGTDSDKLAVSGALTFGGTLNIVSFGGYDLAQAGTYDLFGFGSQSGNFSLVSVSGQALTNNTTYWSATNLGGSGFDYTFTLSTGDLVVAATAVPEPTTYAALVGSLALAGAVWRSRKRA
ncbi:MAG TPA: autotransporter-associated beta strand repeat-containing protein [Rariglobus sp.]|nr:autotransporter-associated beta strand repeat-containing protein [Rariglobus sp.]